MVSDEALKNLQEQIAAWPMAQRFVVKQLIEDYRRDREDLRSYEDTRLTPEETKRMSNILMDVGIDYNCSWEYVKNWLLDDRLRELDKADKDGRLVVLPCKVGYGVFQNLRLQRDGRPWHSATQGHNHCGARHCPWEVYRCRAVAGSVWSKLVPHPRRGGESIGGDEG